jgi:preprotein translocase subunit YajC
MKKYGLIILASLFFTACGAIGGNNASTVGSGEAMKPGDSVVFKSSAVAYNEGKIEKVEGNKYEIRSGNNIAKADASDVYALPKAGSKTDVKTGDYAVAFSNDIYWKGGEVKSVNAETIEVQPSTGDKMTVAQDKIIKVSPAAVAAIKQAVESETFEELGKTKKPVLPKDWKPKKGEKVAAQWSFGSWHVAIIKNVNANNIDIDWQNGWSDGTVATDKVAPYPTGASEMPKTGDYVIMKPQSDSGEWKFATVTSISGQEAELKFADGKTQKAKAGDFIPMS